MYIFIYFTVKVVENVFLLSTKESLLNKNPNTYTF